MRYVMWGVGWWFYIAGWFAIIVTPARVGLAMWQTGEIPRALELVPLAVLISLGVGAVALGSFLRRRNSN
jgi:hypothetical protein